MPLMDNIKKIKANIALRSNKKWIQYIRYVIRLNFQTYDFNLISKKCLKILFSITRYIRTRCFIPLYMHIRISAGCISNLILSVGASAALRVFSEIQFVPLRVFPTFFSPPRHRVHSEKYIRREKERGRKKGKQATRGVHAELFKWAATGGARNSVKFRAKREKSRGRIGLREFWNPRLYEW